MVCVCEQSMKGWEDGMFPPHASFPAGYHFGNDNGNLQLLISACICAALVLFSRVLCVAELCFLCITAVEYIEPCVCLPARSKSALFLAQGGRKNRI